MHLMVLGAFWLGGLFQKNAPLTILMHLLALGAF